MQGDLHGRRRRRLSVRHLVGAGACVFGCSRGGPSAIDAATDAGMSQDATAIGDAGVELTAATRLLQSLARNGQAAAERLAASCDDRAAYLTLRRSAVASMSAWRRRLPVAAEVSFGPEVALQEAGGSLGAIDRALQASDCHGVRAAAERIGGAFRLTRDALEGRDGAPKAFAQALSDAAYRLGQAVLESTPYVPEGDDAALADVLGFLDFLEEGARALALDVTSELAPLERLRNAQTLSDVADRAAIVRDTGLLGSSIRASMRALGYTATLTYRPLRGAPNIGALTLPRPALPVDPAKAELGRRLFFDRHLSASGARACATCHVPDRAYADGLVAPTSLVLGMVLRRNTPSLLYAPLEALLTWDGRVRTADRQALIVLHARAEMGSTDEQLARLVASDRSYADGFRAAFEGGLTPRNVGLALASFEASELVPGNAPIDRFASGDDGALSADDRAGLDVFAGKGRCARCHVPPVFGGSRPPDFTAPIFGVLGVPADPSGHAVDTDVGRGGGDFRVPTVRNVVRTAPYFHHGRYATLEQVVDFYDRGGGRGLGLDVPNQDPEVRPLRLSAEDRRVLLAFLRAALTDSPAPK